MKLNRWPQLINTISFALKIKWYRHCTLSVGHLAIIKAQDWQGQTLISLKYLGVSETEVEDVLLLIWKIQWPVLDVEIVDTDLLELALNISEIYFSVNRRSVTHHLVLQGWIPCPTLHPERSSVGEDQDEALCALGKQANRSLDRHISEGFYEARLLLFQDSCFLSILESTKIINCGICSSWLAATFYQNVWTHIS